MIKIRSFKNNDTRQIIKLITTIVDEFLDCKSNVINDLILDLSDIDKNYIQNWGNFFICKIENEIIWTIALVYKSNRTLILKRMYLESKYRNKWLWKKMLKNAEKWAIENNFKEIILSTYPPFTWEEFYKKNWFKLYKKENKKSFYSKVI